jgi:hypothetical protein
MRMAQNGSYLDQEMLNVWDSITLSPSLKGKFPIVRMVDDLNEVNHHLFQINDVLYWQKNN